MMGQINKTDKLDARGLALLLRNGTLPTVWIPPRSLRDLRELPRFRMKLTRIRTRLKNYIHATLDKYAIHFTSISDLFGVKGRNWLTTRLGELPPETKRCLQQSLQLLDQAQEQIMQTEQRIRDQIEQTPSMQLLQSLPGVGPILSILIALEVGSIERFPCAEKLASYAGTVPRVHSSGGKTYYGPVRHDVNHYLKWAFVEAANAIVMHQKRRPTSHVVHLYRRIRQRRGHGKAIVAVARHLAEATYWMLKKEEVYKEPSRSEVSSTPGQARYLVESERLVA
jgi:transposase